MECVTAGANILQRDIAEDAYFKVEKLLHRICWKFQARYGGDYEEWLSEAHEIFMNALSTHNPAKGGSFITWLYYRLHWGFYDCLRARNLNKTVHWTEDGQEHSGVVVEVRGMKATVIDSTGKSHRVPHRTLLRSEPISLEEMGTEDATGEELFEALSPACITALMGHVEESSQELWELLLDPPAELVEELDENDPEASWDAIQRYIVHVARWNLKQIWTAIIELKEICAE